MKLNKLMLATVIAFASASVAHAASNQGSGKVTFTGEIIDAPCSVAPESVDQTVPMGQISSRIPANRVIQHATFQHRTERLLHLHHEKRQSDLYRHA